MVWRLAAAFSAVLTARDPQRPRMSEIAQPSRWWVQWHVGNTKAGDYFL
jgi:hypothetical protein